MIVFSTWNLRWEQSQKTKSQEIRNLNEKITNLDLAIAGLISNHNHNFQQKEPFDLNTRTVPSKSCSLCDKTICKSMN